MVDFGILPAYTVHDKRRTHLKSKNTFKHYEDWIYFYVIVVTVYLEIHDDMNCHASHGGLFMEEMDGVIDAIVPRSSIDGESEQDVFSLLVEIKTCFHLRSIVSNPILQQQIRLCFV